MTQEEEAKTTTIPVIEKWERCTACNYPIYPIEVQRVPDITGVYHRWCFRCSSCNVGLGKPHYKLNDQGKPICNFNVKCNQPPTHTAAQSEQSSSSNIFRTPPTKQLDEHEIISYPDLESLPHFAMYKWGRLSDTIVASHSDDLDSEIPSLITCLETEARADCCVDLAVSSRRVVALLRNSPSPQNEKQGGISSSISSSRKTLFAWSDVNATAEYLTLTPSPLISSSNDNKSVDDNNNAIPDFTSFTLFSDSELLVAVDSNGIVYYEPNRVGSDNNSNNNYHNINTVTIPRELLVGTKVLAVAGCPDRLAFITDDARIFSFTRDLQELEVTNSIIDILPQTLASTPLITLPLKREQVIKFLTHVDVAMIMIESSSPDEVVASTKGDGNNVPTKMKSTTRSFKFLVAVWYEERSKSYSENAVSPKDRFTVILDPLCEEEKKEVLKVQGFSFLSDKGRDSLMVYSKLVICDESGKFWRYEKGGSTYADRYTYSSDNPSKDYTVNSETSILELTSLTNLPIGFRSIDTLTYDQELNYRLNKKSCDLTSTDVHTFQPGEKIVRFEYPIALSNKGRVWKCRIETKSWCFTKDKNIIKFVLDPGMADYRSQKIYSSKQCHYAWLIAPPPRTLPRHVIPILRSSVAPADGVCMFVDQRLLGQEILCYIFAFLSRARDLARAALVCKAWNEAHKHDELWKTLCKRNMGCRYHVISKNIELYPFEQSTVGRPCSWKEHVKQTKHTPRSLQELVFNFKTTSDSNLVHSVFSFVEHGRGYFDAQITTPVSGGYRIPYEYNCATILFVAMRQNHFSLVEWMLKSWPKHILEHNTDDPKTIGKLSDVLAVCSKGSVAKSLLEKYPDYFTIGKFNFHTTFKTVIQYYDKNLDFELLDLWKQGGAEINALDESGYPAIHHLFTKYSTELVWDGIRRLITDYGVELTLKNKSGKDVADLVKSSKNTEVVQGVYNYYLKQYQNNGNNENSSGGDGSVADIKLFLEKRWDAQFKSKRPDSEPKECTMVFGKQGNVRIFIGNGEVGSTEQLKDLFELDNAQQPLTAVNIFGVRFFVVKVEKIDHTWIFCKKGEDTVFIYILPVCGVAFRLPTNGFLGLFGNGGPFGINFLKSTSHTLVNELYHYMGKNRVL